MADDAEDNDGGDFVPDPDRSQIEIRQLLKRLDPSTGGGHKDRVRRLNRFRNYCRVDEETGNTPEFYDDDLPLLLLGSALPSAMMDEELVGQPLYGLLQACGTPSDDHDSMLKRSARNAMTLLRNLVLDFREMREGEPLDGDASALNPFAVALCSLSPLQLSLMNLESHIEGDKRGGAKVDACSVIVLCCSRHLADDGETTQPLKLEELLPSPRARKGFEQWLQNGATSEQRASMKTVEHQSSKAAAKALLHDLDEEDDDDDEEDDEEEEEEETDSDVEDGMDDGGDILLAKKRQKKHLEKALKKGKKGKHKKGQGPAIRWEECDLYHILQAKAVLDAQGKTGSVRDSQEAMAERQRMEEERAKLLQKDPLGIRVDKDLDLREIDALKSELLEQNLKEIDEEINDIEHDQEKNGSNDKDAQEDVNQRIRNLDAQKESLESILDTVTSRVNRTATDEVGERSILPTDDNFDPMLYLTLVHRKAPYSVLNESMIQLSNKTDNQVQQLQNLVRDNFALFVRCADGIDVFNEAGGDGINERMDSLEGLALVASEQSRKSFKPLLDNTNEVRKVQSALTVLGRVTNILMAPHMMRQHLENGRFSQALKSYRQVLLIDDHCNIELLNHVKEKAAEAAREAQRDLEKRLSEDKISLNSLLDGIKDLSDLLELDIPEDIHEVDTSSVMIGQQTINVRDHPPALACLLLQAAHFKALVEKTIDQAEVQAFRIYEGESSTAGGIGDDSESGAPDMAPTNGNDVHDNNESVKDKTTKVGNQWKYDVLDGRVGATIRAVDLIRSWLPRLLSIGTAAREDEKRRAARGGRRRKGNNSSPTKTTKENQYLSAFEVFLSTINPDVTKLVDHATFCALGSTSRGSGAKEIKMSFGKKAPEKLRTLLKSPLPPTQSSKCARELADLVLVVGEGSAQANGLKPTEKDSIFDYTLSPLDECKQSAEEAVVTVERRRCIFAFDVCARTCSSRASGGGRFDGDALLNCLRTLSEELTRSDECASEVEKGCELVVRRCCEGLASYVRDRGDSARLRAVAECADALTGSLRDVVREVDYMGGSSAGVEEVMDEDVMGLEGAMFDEYLDNIRQNVASCCKIGWLDMNDSDTKAEADIGAPSTFPAYLSASLLAIVRCRAQVERALADKVRRSEGISYQYLAMATAADGVVEGICIEIKQRKSKLKVRQADRLANELQFLMNTLKRYLSDETLAVMDQTRRTLCHRAGRDGGLQGDGPDGLAALEDLERLGRVYLLCLGEA